MTAEGGSLPEYAGNPFIARLPPILSPAEALGRLRHLPRHDPAERLRPVHERLHCLGRLLTYFDPNERHLALESRIDLMIRQGYLGRNPLTTSYYQRLRNDHARVARRDLTAEAVPMVSTASSLTLIGVSGMGKTSSVDRILRRYPESIPHDAPLHIVQVPWVRLECPYKGSVKQLCLSFFARMDELLGTDFARRHGGVRSSLDSAALQMAAIANRHAVGVIVIDEIQHLMEARGTGRDEMLNFLVTLVNHCSTPVLLIGTPKALPLLQGAFRQARRASGLGSLTWDRMPRGRTWDRFIAQLWSCQWTREESPLTDEIREVLYDESQGIIDVVIKLVMLAQMRVIHFSALRPGAERLDAVVLRRTAREHLGLIQPMIEALRSGRSRSLQDYDDLRFLDSQAQDALQSATSEVTSLAAAMPPVRTRTKQESTQPLIDALIALGVPLAQARLMIADAEAGNPEADPHAIRQAVLAMLREGTPPPDPDPRFPTVTAGIASITAPDLPPQDLRQIGIEAPHRYPGLLTSNLVRPPANDPMIVDASMEAFRR